MGCDSSKELKVVTNHSSDAADSNEKDKTAGDDENSVEPEIDTAEGEWNTLILQLLLNSFSIDTSQPQFPILFYFIEQQTMTLFN